MCDRDDAREDNTISADELVAHGFDLLWVLRLPVVTYHQANGDPYWIRAELGPWLRGEGGQTS